MKKKTSNCFFFSRWRPASGPIRREGGVRSVSGPIRREGGVKSVPGPIRRGGGSQVRLRANQEGGWGHVSLWTNQERGWGQFSPMEVFGFFWRGGGGRGGGVMSVLETNPTYDMQVLVRSAFLGPVRRRRNSHRPSMM